MKHDAHDYGFVIFPISGGKSIPDARFAIVDLDSDEDGFYLECEDAATAERELVAHVQWIVAEGC